VGVLLNHLAKPESALFTFKYSLCHIIPVRKQILKQKRQILKQKRQILKQKMVYKEQKGCFYTIFFRLQGRFSS